MSTSFWTLKPMWDLTISCPNCKGSTVQSRLITTWGDVRDMIDKQVKKTTAHCKIGGTQAAEWAAM